MLVEGVGRGLLQGDTSPPPTQRQWPAQSEIRSEHQVNGTSPSHYKMRLLPAHFTSACNVYMPLLLLTKGGGMVLSCLPTIQKLP